MGIESLVDVLRQTSVLRVQRRELHSIHNCSSLPDRMLYINA